MSNKPKNLKQSLDEIQCDLSPLRKDGNLYDELVDLRADVNKECPGPGKCNDPGCPAFYAHESPVKGEQG